MFKAFKPEAMNKIAGAMGYTGNMDSFQQYIEQDPARKARMNGFVKAAQTMAKGGMVKKMANGGMIGQVSNAAGGYNPQTGQFTPLNQLPQGGGLIGNQIGAVGPGGLAASKLAVREAS